ncbi:hypothetical protein HS088_TW12G00110 [Tripterygium wilfordii]|uniref:LOB domain-containing protein n=1 Tax=Tripterygium wilfordii TaxID=458696 RepID=A0A7J7CXX0_TRIWF|nr:LOB domain-containing protein 29-like [Tripterygium wilfordii]XP_038718614.1 LOB domain-containing protein 29-like [Tripterygium wilfordii]KAF5738914.1 hypothetical protein HS088_TW12G00110 [Tripterygium wilfordii]
MAGSSSGSPCGACKFLRRKCLRGCVFAPYFCHEQGATHFAAIHKVFGASNVSKLLAHLPVNDRCEAAVTISYEAQARVQDPIYGCVSHIFALQQQVVNLEAQLASLKQQAARTFVNGTGAINPNERFYGEHASSHTQDHVQSWIHHQLESSSEMVPQFNIPNLTNNISTPHYENALLDPKDNVSLDGFEEGSNSNGVQTNSCWNFHDSARDDLQSVAFGYMRHS